MGDVGDEICRLMAKGLDLYALGQVSEATACWQRVLSLDPAHPEARDYLQAAGCEPEPAAPPPRRAPRLLDEALRQLRARAFPEALDLLETQVRKEPADLEGQAFLDLARATLLRVYRTRAGSGDRVPRLRIQPSEVMKYNLPAPAGFLLSLIDGRIALDELLAVSGMDPFDALRALANLLDAGIVEARA